MGTVYKRKSRSGDGSTRGIFYIDYRDESGRRYREAIGYSKRAAERALRQREAEVLSRKFGYSRKTAPEFEKFSEYWLENYSRVQNSPAQYRKNRIQIRKHLLPYFGGTAIDA